MLRVLLIALAIVGAVVGVWLAGYVLFDSGGSVPGSGTAETVTAPTP
jgi:hypothetical protein